MDVKQVGRDLGVRYVLEGSVRTSGNRVRITGQLIDTSTGAHLWADRFDGAIEDVFDLQDQVTTSVIGAIAPKLQQVESERAARKAPQSLDAWENFVRGVSLYSQHSNGGTKEAINMLNRAVSLDPGYAQAHGCGPFAWRGAPFRDGKIGIPPSQRLPRVFVALLPATLTNLGHSLHRDSVLSHTGRIWRW